MQCYITVKSQNGQDTMFDALTSSEQLCGAWNRNVSVNSIEVSKELYTPNVVQIQIQIGSGTGSLGMNKIIDDLMEANLSVWSVPGTDTNESYRSYLALNYPIHQVQPVFGAAQLVNITAYSPEIQLTYDKFCATWVGKRLAQELVPSVLDSTFASTGLSECLLAANLCQLRYNNSKELIQPYLVQYNESFYDFLRRVAYRCGEYLYWENNQLNLGLNTRVDVRKGVEFSQCEACRTFQSKTSISAVHRDIFKESIADSNGNLTILPSGPSYYESVSSEDFFDKVKEYDKTFVDYWEPQKQITRYVSTTLQQGNLADMLVSIATNISIDMLTAHFADDKAKEGYNKIWSFDGGGAAVRSMQPDQYAKENNKQTYTMYSSAALGGTLNLGAAYYQKMQKGSKQITNTMMKVTLITTKYQHVGLGDIIQLKDNQDDQYIVVRIYRKETTVGQGSDIEYTLDVVLFDRGNLFPPVPRQEISFPLIREAAPQTAFVAKSGDPLEMGRVCIKYPWQQSDEDASPWIRMSSQMASKDSGFFFDPHVNDEVLINFVGGNVENPYVAGCLYSAGHKPAGSSAITSTNGHSITFSDPEDGSGWMFMNEFLPIIGFITGKLDDKDDDKKKQLQQEIDAKLNALRPSSGLIDDASDVDVSKSEGLVNAYFLKQKLDLARKFYAAAVCKPKAFKSVVPSSLYKKIQFDKQLTAEKDNVTEDEYNTIKDQEIGEAPITEKDKEAWKKNKKIEKFLEKKYVDILQNRTAYFTNLDKLGSFIREKLQVINALIAACNYLTGNQLNKKKQEIAIAQAALEPYQLFYQNASKQDVTWSEVGIADDQKDDYIKNAQFLMHKHEIIKSLTVKNASGVFQQAADGDWAELKDKWTDEKKAKIATLVPDYDISFQNWGSTNLDELNKEYQKDATGYQDSASDERWFIPSVNAYSVVKEKDALGREVSRINTNLLDKLAAKIKVLDAKLKNIVMPEKADNCKNDTYKDYLNKKAELSKLQEKKSNSAFKKGDGCFAGGITMADTMGFYKISMDAGSRNISISSPVGDVSIDAFTGITISAPTGDINIVGKNINLTAGNNVKIVSGTNKAAKTVGQSLQDIGSGVIGAGVGLAKAAFVNATKWAGLVDLSTLRVVYECLIQPVEGTLQIHSGNNLILESNNAKAELPLADISKRSNRNQLKRSRIQALSKALDMIINHENNLLSFIAPLSGATDSLVKTLNLNTTTGAAATTCAGLFGKKFANGADFTSTTTTNFVKKLFSTCTNGKEFLEPKEFKESDFYDEKADGKLTKRQQQQLKTICGECNAIRGVIKDFCETINGLDKNMEDIFDTTGAADLATTIKTFYTFKDTQGNIIQLKNNQLKPIDAIADMWTTNHTTNVTTFTAKSEEDRRNALKQVVKATIYDNYETTYFEDGMVSIWKTICSMFGSDLKPVAVYENIDAPTEKLSTALNAIPCNTGTKADWSNMLDNLKEPKANAVLEAIKGAITGFLGDITGWDGLVSNAQGMIDDWNGMSAQRTGKLLVSTFKDSTLQMDANGQFVSSSTGSPSLEKLKKDLVDAW